jgi:pyruvate formate lyase activating enzyme
MPKKNGARGRKVQRSNGHATLSGAGCRVCGTTPDTIVASRLGVCARCIKHNTRKALPHARQIHVEARARFGLPEQPPHAPRGVPCGVCMHECRMGPGERGYCNLRENDHGAMRLRAGEAEAGLLRWSYEPLPTSCVAMDVCGERATTNGENLAVFYGSCTLHCLSCPSARYLDDAVAGAPVMSADELGEVSESAACISFFGGDPTPQAPHALVAARRARERHPVRVCWETNGLVHPAYLNLMIDESLATGGTLKFDLKTWNDALHVALSGFSNRRTLENFAVAARRAAERAEPPLVVASTPLIPGYVDVEEVGALARFIASFDRTLPYRLLPFVPAFMMDDLPATTVVEMERCLAAARAAGLTRVAAGSQHLILC